MPPPFAWRRGAALFQIMRLGPKFLAVHAALARPAMEISMSVVSRLRSFAIATLLGLSVAGCGYNTIPTLEENAKAKWAEVQAQYQRRADLIPNLVATVQGYAKQEKDVLTQVAEARAKATQIKIDASSLTDPD